MGMTELPTAALALAPHDRLAWLLGRKRVEPAVQTAETPRTPEKTELLAAV